VPSLSQEIRPGGKGESHAVVGHGEGQFLPVTADANDDVLRLRPEEEAVPTAKAGTVAPSRVAEAPAPVAKPAPPTPDDLKRIEGIGPKISSVLQAAGIMTFAQLAATDMSRLRQILTEAGLAALADPTTWPEQANLAAAGKWDALEVLQDELKGGRRV
jgi:predicted flap endonuclease-1-like 5' DNA nuclease